MGWLQIPNQLPRYRLLSIEVDKTGSKIELLKGEPLKIKLNGEETKLTAKKGGNG